MDIIFFLAQSVFVVLKCSLVLTSNLGERQIWSRAPSWTTLNIIYLFPEICNRQASHIIRRKVPGAFIGHRLQKESSSSVVANIFGL